MKTFLILLFIISGDLLFAQNSSISGKIFDQNKLPISGATVLLFKANKTKLLRSILSDSVGVFIFENLKNDSLKIQISAEGFDKYEGENLIINEINTELNLNNIMLLPSIGQLAEVTVKAQKPFISQQIDRVVINPEALISSAGSNTLEVLEKAPGILIDQNGNISFKGKSGLQVFINDKPSYLTASELANYLRSMPVSTIESIELIHNPPAKYDAAGNAGIINIKTKKITAKGISTGLSLAYGQGRHIRSNNSFNLNIRRNKINFFNSVSFTQNNSYQDLSITRNYFTPTGVLQSVFTQNSLIKPQNRGQNLKMGMDVYPNKNTSFGVVFSGFINPSKRIVNNFSENKLGTGLLLNTVKANIPMDIDFRNANLNLNLAQKFKNRAELSGNLDFIKFKTQIDQTLTNEVEDKVNISPIKPTILNSKLPSDIGIGSFKMDFTTPMKWGTKMEAGLKASFVNTQNEADFNDIIDGQKVPNLLFSNIFKYKENINAAYLNASQDLTKISFQIGFRFESTNIKGNQLGNVAVKDSSFKRNYANIFPTVFVQFRADSAQKHVFSINTGRRIDRPNYKDMNPFTYPLDKFTFYAGNPFLQPTFTYNSELSYTYKGTWTFALEHSFARNVINETNEQQGTVWYSRPGNFDKQISYGASLNGQMQLTKWWTANIYATAMNNIFSSRVYTEELDDSRWYTVIMPTNQFVINSKWSAELAGSYQSKVLSGQFLVIPIWSARMGVATKILKNKGSLKLNVNDIFYTYQVGGDIRNIANATASWFSYLDTRVATLSFSYNFNKGQNLAPRRSGGSEAEQKRVKT